MPVVDRAEQGGVIGHPGPMTTVPRLLRDSGMDRVRVLAVAAVAGCAAASAGARPTGATGVDVVIVAVCAAAVTWASASAPWWAPTAAAGIGALVAFQPAVSAAGVAGVAGGIIVGLRRNDPAMRAAVGGVAVNVLVRSELGGFFGLSAIVGITTCVGLFVLGVACRTRHVRRAAALVALALVALAVVAAGATAVAVVDARSDVSAAADRSREAIDALRDGDYAAAADLFGEAADRFAGAEKSLGGTTASPAALIPGLAQNVRAGHDLADAAATAATGAADALRAADLSSVQVVDGAIDVAAVRALEVPLVRLRAVLDELSEVAGEADSPWLVEPVRAELVDLGEDLTENRQRLDDAIEAVRIAPSMLGGDGQRRYLVLFTTPAEARGLGGSIGDFAEVTVVDGRFTVTEFDRLAGLADVLAERPAFCAGCPAELLERYGRFGFDSGPNGSVDPQAWSNLTMPAHFPYVAETAAVLYPQSGGGPLDGVVVMDAYAVEALMGFTGSISIPGLGLTVEPDDAAGFILEEQYLIGAGGLGDPTGERADALEVLGQAVVARLLTSSLPDLADIGAELAPLIDERRVMMWSADESELEFLGRVGALGALPELGPDGGFSVSASNVAGNKIDVFLERTVEVVVDVADDGARRLTTTVSLVNGAPASGLPDVVIGNALGLPTGTSRLYVTLYGPSELVRATRDGGTVELERSTEAGWSTYSEFVELAPGQQVDYVAVFELAPTVVGPGPPVGFEQPLARR